MKVKRFVAGVWAKYWGKALLCVLLAAVVGVLGILTFCQVLTSSEFIEIFTLVVLVAVTTWYAASTQKIQRAVQDQTKVSRDAVETALRAERNSVMPIVKLEGHGPYYGFSATASFENVGKGPALGLKLSAIVSPDSDGDCVVSDPVAIPVLEVAKVVKCMYLSRKHRDQLSVAGESVSFSYGHPTAISMGNIFSPHILM